MRYFFNVPISTNAYIEASKDKYFVDKSQFIDEMNKCIGTMNKYICITRPRRFGKTINAMMLASYYSKSANFKHLFDKLNISKCDSYLEHLNKHNVIYMTLNEMPGSSNCSYQEFIDRYYNLLIKDLKNQYNMNFDLSNRTLISDIFARIHGETGEQFIFILDEWDFIFNNNLFSEQERERFLQFLKDLLKDRPYVELAYMTGVLPIAKYCSGSSLNMFREFNFMNDVRYDRYFGFTSDEVNELCKKQSKLSMKDLKEWYNGYKTQTGLEIYNPRSVCHALSDGICQSYWTNTGPMDEIIYYIKNNVEDIRNDIVKMVSGFSVFIHLEGHGAEKLSLNTRDDILSAMTVYGFLTYHDDTLEIPNKELRLKFDYSLKDHSLGAISELVLKSNQMLEATFRKDTETMASIIEEAHQLNVSIIKYNDENSLACIITLVYLSARSQYHIIREMPSGKGFADFVFIPNNKSKPAFIIELKKDSTPDDALKQIEEKNYASSLKDCTGLKLAIGVSYSSKDKKHSVKVVEI